MTQAQSVLTNPASGVNALGSTVTNVWVNGGIYKQQPPIVDVQLHQSFNAHDMVYTRIEYPNSYAGSLSNLSLWQDDTPVALQWGRYPDTNVWYGYVNHKEINSISDSGTGAFQVTYAMIGTSSVLNPSVMKGWTNTSPTNMLASIASKNGFRAVTTPVGPNITYEAQSGSDFQHLGEMANKWGYRFWASGGSMYMISPTSALQGAGAGVIPQFQQNKIPNLLDTCRNFKYSKGKNLPGSVQSTRTVFGIDASSGTPFSATAVPAGGANGRVTITSSYATQNYGDAQNRMNAWSNLSQFWIGATAQFYGTTNLYPGKLVLIQGSALPENAGGYWLVSQVKHSISNDLKAGQPWVSNFTSDVVLLRNLENTDVKVSGFSTVNPEFNQMKLVGGQWKATSAPLVKL